MEILACIDCSEYFGNFYHEYCNEELRLQHIMETVYIDTFANFTCENINKILK